MRLSKKITLFLRLFIIIDIIVMTVIFLHMQFHLHFPFPVPGKRLNNPLGSLFIATFLLGFLDSKWRDRWLNRIRQWVTGPMLRNLFFGGLFAGFGLLEMMHFQYPDEQLWNLNVEKGYGTYFSTFLLYLLGLIVVIIYREEGKDPSKRENRWLWLPVAFVYFYLTLDECLGIHEQFIMVFQDVWPNAKAFHFIHEWLWFYAPFIAGVAFFLGRFFLWRFKKEIPVILILFLALSLWISVIFYEGLSKNIIDPMGYGVLLIGMEEGSEMLGSILFIIGFSRHLRKNG